MRPLYYDALSGEFTPPEDPLNRQHTLGRLAYATFAKGDIVTGSSDQVLCVCYEPSWAPPVASVVECNVEVHTGAISVTSLSLLVTGKGPATFSDAEIRRGTRGLLMTNDAGDDLLGLRIGDELTHARIRVTQAASEFFAMAAQL